MHQLLNTVLGLPLCFYVSRGHYGPEDVFCGQVDKWARLVRGFCRLWLGLYKLFAYTDGWREAGVSEPCDENG